MNAQEAAALCRFAKSCAPQQRFDEYTPDAWYLQLDDIDFADAKQAVVSVTREQPFVSAAEIRQHVRARRESIDLRQIPATDPPSALADHPQAEQQWILTYKRAIADGADEPTARRIACRAHDTADDDRPELNPEAARELTQAITNITDAKRSKRARPKETA